MHAHMCTKSTTTQKTLEMEVHLPVPPPTLAESLCLQLDIEWVGGSSGVGCGSHIPPETQITLQETPALQHTAWLWFINTGDRHIKTLRHTLQARSAPPSLSHFPPFFCFLPAFPVILQLVSATSFPEKIHHMFVLASVKWFLTLVILYPSAVAKLDASKNTFTIFIQK